MLSLSLVHHEERIVYLSRTLLAIVALSFAGVVPAEVLVAEFSGSGSHITEEFKIEGPWLLDWGVRSDFPSEAGIEITLVDAVFLNNLGMVLQARYPDAGTRMFRTSGRFRFRVSATLANWNLRVSKITEEEAATMIPKRPPPRIKD